MSVALISTIKERCRKCYTCVRECPAKAIRIVAGQAEVVPERCIVCGNCVRVCSQNAKRISDSILQVRALLDGPDKTAACVAPSFPAEFTETDDLRFAGMLRALGFDFVHEVAFGADLVARCYKALLDHSNGGGRFIAANCPAIVGYVERYHPDLTGSIAPIVSPMIATARVIRRLHGPEVKTVFISPCIAKKAEALDPAVAGDIDAVLTFGELRTLLAQSGIAPEAVAPNDFDRPHGGAGALFPVGGGMLQAAEIREDLMTGEVVAAEGRTRFLEAIKEFASGDLGARLLEVLCCEGCIMGVEIQNDLPLFNRRRHVRKSVVRRMERLDKEQWEADVRRFADLALARGYAPDDQRIAAPAEHEITEMLQRMGKFRPDDELNCGACGYDTCREHAIAIFKGLAESQMCLPYMIDCLQTAVNELKLSNEQLADTREALFHSEKLASMGQLAAAVAHEVNNPLGIVLMYAHLLLEESTAGSETSDDLKMIVEQADRCKKIVAGLLHFARQNKVTRRPTDWPRVAERAVHAMHLPETVRLEIRNELADPLAEIDGDQMTQVLTNLVNNAVVAMEEVGSLIVRFWGDDQTVRFSVVDTGKGIPEENLSKIFDPFFTTKQMGKGTGLGLAISYGIVKMHNGDIQVETNADSMRGPTGTTFTVSFSRREPKPVEKAVELGVRS